MINYSSSYFLYFLLLAVFQGYGKKYLVNLEANPSNEIKQKTEERYFKYMNIEYRNIKKYANLSGGEGSSPTYHIGTLNFYQGMTSDIHN